MNLLFTGALMSLTVGVSAPQPARAQAAAATQTTTASTTAERRFDEALARARTSEDHLVALAHAQVALRQRLNVPTRHVAESLLRAAKVTRSPLARVVLERGAEYALRDLNDLRHGPLGMKGPVGAQGWITTFSLLGPFDNPSMEAFTPALEPERAEAGPYRGKGGTLTWRTLQGSHRFGQLNLPSFVEPSDAAVVYLSATLDSKKQRDAFLMLGASGQYRVWLNGALVGERARPSSFARDNDAWKVRLKRGANTVLIKLASDTESGLELAARLVDSKLRPITDVTARATRPSSAVQSKVDPKQVPKPAPVGVLSMIQQAAKTGQGEAAVWAAWLWRLHDRGDAATPWRDTAERLLAAYKKDPNTLSPQALARLATLFDEQWRRRALVEEALRRAPADPWIATQLASVYERSIALQTRQKQRELLQKTVQKHPTHIPALLELADWYSSRGLSAAGLKILQKHSTPKLLQAPQFAMRLGSFHERTGAQAKADALQRALSRDAYISSGWAWREIDRLQKQGKYAEAIKHVQTRRAQAPWALAWSTREARLLRLSGKTDAALALLKKLSAERPGEMDLYHKRAELLVAKGEKEAAIKVLAEAIKHRPQDTRTRELLAHLRPRTNRFHEPWMIADLAALSKQTPAGPFDRSTLVNQTIINVAPNGLSQRVTQVAYRVNTTQGLNDAKFARAYYQTGDEEVEVLGVRVIKPDGSVTQDFDTWSSGKSRKGTSTYNDTAYLTIRANNVKVGDIVEFRYQRSEIANQNFRGDYFGDLEYVQDTEPIALARYAVLYPKSWTMHFRAPKLKHRRITDQLPDGKPAPKGTHIAAFELKNVPYVKTDPSQPGHTDVYDYILVSNKKTYDEVGVWWWNLVKEQLIVDGNIRKTVRKLTKNLKTDDQKLRAIHNYVVKNTRYLHVGLGIHGWKPYRTTTCFRNRYGDCKDKASLLKVMLEEAGIKANLVLVRTRRLGTVEAFPASMHIFNHAITYVPAFDLYLDGTAEFNGTRELTSMDQGAQALIVMNGGKTRWVTLPVDKSGANLIKQDLVVDLSGKEPVVKGKIVARGGHAVHLRTALEDPERRNETFEKILAQTYPGARLVKAKYSDLQALEKPVTITYTFRGGRLLRQNGKRRYVFPNGAPKELLDAYAKQATRNQDLTIRIPFANHTRIRYRIPKSRAFGAVPANTKLKTRFGGLDLKYTKEKGALVVDVQYSLDVQRVSVKDYKNFRKFVSDVDAALNRTVDVKTPQ